MAKDAAYLLHLADNALILGQRNAEWCGHGPVLEEDIAMANMSLDLIGQARLLYQLAGKRENQAEDHYAYWRAEHEFRNFTLCELPHSATPLSGNSKADRDYAITIVRNVFYSTYMALLWQQLAKRDDDAELAAIAVKSAKETRYHLQHATDWLTRLGDGTDESHARAQQAVHALYPYTQEFWLNGDDLYSQWTASIKEYLHQATLELPAESGLKASMSARGSLGLHSEHMGYLLAEMQSVARAHPGAQW